MKSSKKLVPESAEQFRINGSGDYVFPFDVLDPQYGRIQWMIELYPGKKFRGENRRRLGKIWVWATQTKDKRYHGKIFEIETNAECLTTDATLRRNTAYVPWRIMFCEQHKGAVILDAYPENGCTKLIINAFSSISVEAKFQ